VSRGGEGGHLSKENVRGRRKSSLKVPTPQRTTHRKKRTGEGKEKNQEPRLSPWKKAEAKSRKEEPMKGD